MSELRRLLLNNAMQEFTSAEGCSEANDERKTGGWIDTIQIRGGLMINIRKFLLATKAKGCSRKN